jgi:hypothetical protein
VRDGPNRNDRSGVRFTKIYIFYYNFFIFFSELMVYLEFWTDTYLDSAPVRERDMATRQSKENGEREINGAKYKGRINKGIVSLG